MATIREQFKALDKDGNGSISPADLRQILTNCGEKKFIEAVVNEMMEKSDINHDGKIDYTEFFIQNSERLLGYSVSKDADKSMLGYFIRGGHRWRRIPYCR